MTLRTNPTFEAIRRRRAVRHFSSREIPEDAIVELLDLANHAPSGFNLQPWQFILVRNPELKRLLVHIVMGQTQVEEAPLTVVFVADPYAWKSSYPKLLEIARSTGLMPDRVIDSYRRNTRIFFRHGPLGIRGFGKKIVVPIRRLFKPTPVVATSYAESCHYVRAQTMLAAATFMIAAKSIGIDSCPMEGFDEDRLKKLLAVPRHMTIPIIIPVGFALDEFQPKPALRLPLEEKLSIDLFTNKVRRGPRKVGGQGT